MAKEIVKRVGGEASAAQFQRLCLSGWNGSCEEGARYCADSIRKAREPDNKQREIVPLGERKGLWKRYGTARFPELSSVALRLLSIHPASAATERNWSLWGRVYTSARNALGLERAKALIMFCFNDRCNVTDQQDFNLLLSVVEGEFAEEVGPIDMVGEAGCSTERASGAGDAGPSGQDADSDSTI
jgi:hypothetical protein